jgi:hypothetical protein
MGKMYAIYIELYMKGPFKAALKGNNSCNTHNFKISQKCENGLCEVNNFSLPATTLSMACSKCFFTIEGFRSLAAINAASLHTLAMSAPEIYIMDCNYVDDIYLIVKKI